MALVLDGILQRKVKPYTIVILQKLYFGISRQICYTGYRSGPIGDIPEEPGGVVAIRIAGTG